MRLPNAARAVVDIAKLRDYCLNPDHPVGKHKARVFASAPGLGAADAYTLMGAVLRAATECEATPTRAIAHGQLYTLDFEMAAAGREVMVRTAWIVRTGEDFPHLTTCYVV